MSLLSRQWSQKGIHEGNFEHGSKSGYTVHWEDDAGHGSVYAIVANMLLQVSRARAQKQVITTTHCILPIPRIKPENFII